MLVFTFVLLCIIWGSTWLAIKVSLEGLPPSLGAAFRFLSGHVERAPAWLGKLGLEWAYRLMKEPRKCWRRSLIEGPRFLFHVALQLTGIKKYD